MKEQADEHLMELVQQDQLDCLELLFLRYQRSIYNYFLRCTSDQEQSRDLTQSTFVRILKYRKSYRTDGVFRTWLFGIARNLLRDHYQEMKRTREQHGGTGYHPEADDGEASREQQEQEERLHEAMARLPVEKRELLVMSKFHGMKYEELAAIRGTTVGAIKVQIHRIIAQLRTIYFEELHE